MTSHPPTLTDRDGYEAVVSAPCSVRRFRREEVPQEDVEHMVALATRAASACDRQAWRLIAIRDRELLGAMGAAVIERFEELAFRPRLALREHERMVARAQALAFTKAPLCVAVLALPVVTPMEHLLELAGMSQDERDRLCVRPELQSAGAATQLLVTSAHAMGYAACWTCAPVIAGERLQELLGVEPPTRLAAIVSIGRPADLPMTGARPPLDEVLAFR